ncbi:hypothetical protein M3Y96_00162100 [Aphelenchoides besseyi]|nr:hypothetical protein M3Y96_00162100 [Aphelenchoides besseyi]
MTHTQTLILQQLSDRLSLVMYLVGALTIVLVILLCIESAMFVYTIQSNSKPAKKKTKPQKPASVIVIGRSKNTVSITLTDSKSLCSKNAQSKKQSLIKKSSSKNVSTKSVDKVNLPSSKKTLIAKDLDEAKKREAKPVESLTTTDESDKSNATVNQTAEAKQEVKPRLPPSSAHSSVTSISSFNSSILNDSGAQKNQEANKSDLRSPPVVLKTAIEKPPALGPNGETAPIASPPRTLSPPNSLMMNENKLIPIKGPSNAAGLNIQNDF